ncbi:MULTISPECIES: hypothetical protein [unclassified Afipia]|jgi:hypothetical protein|uniref:hypothetical protein n=1 Tax=unclassified Afipia TaxID=2642050 RepID=UPI0004651C77|nr:MULTISPECIES: hypothetical protein [unclassified Afipia]WIG49219.1 MAG: hypothetical protein OJF48_000134 [Afipia sp.]
MVAPVSDYRANKNEHILHAISVLKRSPRRIKVFMEIYKGSKQSKTVAEIMAKTGLTQVAVLQDGGKLSDEQIVETVKVRGKIAYKKVAVYKTNKAKILSGLKKSSTVLNTKYPTKQTPRVTHTVRTIRVAQGLKVQARPIVCDDIANFSKIKRIKSGPKKLLPEKKIKTGFAKILKDRGVFKDWGGEKNDLFSNATVAGARRRIAFAFKGPATTGVLTPAKLGKNGDQIQRLFETAASVFIIQYHGQIAESVLQQMQTFAEIKSLKENNPIWYGIIDGNDTDRLISAYPDQFK